MSLVAYRGVTIILGRESLGTMSLVAYRGVTIILGRESLGTMALHMKKCCFIYHVLILINNNGKRKWRMTHRRSIILRWLFGYGYLNIIIINELLYHSILLMMFLTLRFSWVPAQDCISFSFWVCVKMV